MSLFEKAFNAVKKLVGYYHPLNEVPSYIATPNNLIRGTTTIQTKHDLPLDIILRDSNVAAAVATTTLSPTHNLDDTPINPSPYDIFCFYPSSSTYGPDSDSEMVHHNIKFYDIEIPLTCVKSFFVFNNSSSFTNHKSSDILDPRLFPDTYMVNNNNNNRNVNITDPNTAVINTPELSNEMIDNPYDCSFIVFCKIGIYLPNELYSTYSSELINSISDQIYIKDDGCTFFIHMMFYRKDVKRIFYIFNFLYPQCTFVDKPNLEPTTSRKHTISDIEIEPFMIANVDEILELSKIFDKKHIDNLLKYIPTRYNNYSMNLVYSSHIHGSSLNNLYRHVVTYEENALAETPYILVIKDMKNKVFGAYLTEPLHLSSSYYGTGECFVFTYGRNKQINVYHWNTSSSTNYIFCDRNYVDIGSQNGVSALWIDENLYHGRSQKNTIFDNEQLSSSEYFIIYVFELWNFVE